MISLCTIPAIHVHKGQSDQLTGLYSSQDIKLRVSPGDKGHNYQAFSKLTAISPSVTCQTRTNFQYVKLELTHNE